MVFSRRIYSTAVSLQNDYLVPIGTYEFHIISSVPGTTLNYASIIQPFDVTGWALIAASAISILAMLIVISKVSVKEMKKRKMSIHKSTHNLVYIYTLLHEIIILSFICVIGFLTTIGALIEESQPHEQHHNENKDYAKSREVLLIVWLVAGFCLTILYKSTLSAELAIKEYLTPIDSVEDVIDSGKPIYVYGKSTYDERMHSDPRANVRKLAKNHVQLYDFDSTGVPKYVRDA